MTYYFIQTTDDLSQVLRAKATYKIPNNVFGRMVDECDKLWGADNWVTIQQHDNTFDNLIGWYAREKNGYDTLEVSLNPIN